MIFSVATFGLAYVAGLLSTLSPCVLPLLPILLAAAASAHRLGPLALAGGLALSFTAIGLFLATVGAGLGLEAGTLRQGGAVVMVLLGGVMLSERVQARLAVATSGLGVAGAGVLDRLRLDGWPGQALIGLVLGVVWSPCVGPTLGAAAALATQGGDLQQVALLMFLFGIGAGTPLLLIGMLSRGAPMRWRARLRTAGRTGKALFGGLLVAIGITVFTGMDRRVEAWAVQASPAWLTALTTRF